MTVFAVSFFRIHYCKNIVQKNFLNSLTKEYYIWCIGNLFRNWINCKGGMFFLQLYMFIVITGNMITSNSFYWSIFGVDNLGSRQKFLKDLGLEHHISKEEHWRWAQMLTVSRVLIGWKYQLVWMTRILLCVHNKDWRPRF